jgi:hypothetical protein
MAVYAKELTRAAVIYSNATLIVAGNSVNSGFIRLPRRDVTVTKTHTTGTYGISIDWSMDGTNVAFTTTPTMVNNVPQTLTALAPYAKFTISCTGTTFTVHQTTIMA